MGRDGSVSRGLWRPRNGLRHLRANISSSRGVQFPVATRAGDLVGECRSDPVAGWVRAAVAGDRRAFGQLYRQFAPTVHGVLLSRVSADLAHDLVQETFLQAMTRLESLRDPGAFGPWVVPIARNRATNATRGRVPSALSEESLGVTDEVHVRALETLGMIRELPEAYRETMVLRLVEGMTGPEISAHTGLSHGSVRVNLHRGMKLLRTKLTERGLHV